MKVSDSLLLGAVVLIIVALCFSAWFLRKEGGGAFSAKIGLLRKSMNIVLIVLAAAYVLKGLVLLLRVIVSFTHINSNSLVFIFCGAVVYVVKGVLYLRIYRSYRSLMDNFVTERIFVEANGVAFKQLSKDLMRVFCVDLLAQLGLLGWTFVVTHRLSVDMFGAISAINGVPLLQPYKIIFDFDEVFALIYFFVVVLGVTMVSVVFERMIENDRK